MEKKPTIIDKNRITVPNDDGTFSTNVTFVEFKDIERDNRPRGPSLKSTEKKVTIEQYAKMLVDGRVIANSKQRKINAVHARQIAEAFNVDALEDPIAVETKDGKYQLLDTHHQATAIWNLYKHNKLLPAELEKKITIKVFAADQTSEAVLAVRMARNNKRGWTSFDKIVGTETPFGNVFINVVGHFEHQGRKDLNVSKATQVASIMYAWANHKKSDPTPKYCRMYHGSRHRYEKLADFKALRSEFELSDRKLEELKEAMAWAFGICDRLRKDKEFSGQSTRKLSTSTVFFGYLVYLALWHKIHVKDSPAYRADTYLCKNIKSNDADMPVIVRDLGLTGIDDKLNAEERIEKALRLKLTF